MLPDGARNDGDDGEEDFAAPHFGEGCGAVAAAPLFHIGFGGADFGDLQVEVAIPFEGVHSQVEMGVDQQHGAGGMLPNTP